MTKSQANQVKWSPKQNGVKKEISLKKSEDVGITQIKDAKENQNERKPQKVEMDKVQEMDSNWGYSQAWEATKMVLNEV